MVFIYRQEILKDISFFTSQPKAKFYDELFINLDLSCIPAYNSKIGRAGYSNHSIRKYHLRSRTCNAQRRQVFRQRSHTAEILLSV